MSTEPEGRSEHNEAAEVIKEVERSLARTDEELKRLDEEIREAERKSKVIIPDPET